jgi:hypothetical protein
MRKESSHAQKYFDQDEGLFFYSPILVMLAVQDFSALVLLEKLKIVKMRTLALLEAQVKRSSRFYRGNPKRSPLL